MRLLDALLGKPKPQEFPDEEKIVDGEEADPTGPDLFDEGDDDPEEDAKRQKHYVAVFAFLLANTTHRIDTLTDHLADEKLTTQEWAKHFREELTAAHSEAFLIGRRLAGDAKALNQADLTGGTEAWGRQEEFFAKFLSDLETGRYTNEDGSLNEKGFGNRARAYGKSTGGTVHESFRQAMGTDPLAWILGDKIHCVQTEGFDYNCPDLSEEEPKPADEWPTSPRFGDTPCVFHCDCHFESVDGRFSTEGI